MPAGPNYFALGPADALEPVDAVPAATLLLPYFDPTPLIAYNYKLQISNYKLLTTYNKWPEWSIRRGLG